jgi:DNA excision repair protein ERCC-3
MLYVPYVQNALSSLPDETRRDVRRHMEASGSRFGDSSVFFRSLCEVLIPWKVEFTMLCAMMEYQNEVASNCVTRQKCVVNAPCGSGKTLIGIDVWRRLQTTCLVVTHSHEAAAQWQNTIVSRTSLSASDITYAEGLDLNCTKLTACVITTYSTLIRCKKKETNISWLLMKRRYGVLILDEVQYAVAEHFRMCLMAKATSTYGFSATLVREDDRMVDLTSFFGDSVVTVNLVQLVAKKILPSVSLRNVVVAESRDHSNVLESALSLLRRFQGTKHVIVVCDCVRTVLKLYALAHERKIHTLRPITMRTKMSDRLDRISTFNENAPKTADCAVDMPSSNVIIQLLCLTSSRQQEGQRIGRVQRFSGGVERNNLSYCILEDTPAQRWNRRHRDVYVLEMGYSEIEYIHASGKRESPEFKKGDMCGTSKTRKRKRLRMMRSSSEPKLR